MITVFIPPQFRVFADGTESVGVKAASVRQAIERLDEQFPGIADRLCQDDELRPSGLKTQCEKASQPKGMRGLLSLSSHTQATLLVSH